MINDNILILALVVFDHVLTLKTTQMAGSLKLKGGVGFQCSGKISFYLQNEVNYKEQGGYQIDSC